MAVWECAECTAQYAVGLPKCPQCSSVIRVDERTQPKEDEAMAKVTVHGGPSIDGAVVDPDSGEITPVDAEGGEGVSAGSSSSASSETESSAPESSETGTRSPARTTGSRSKKARTDSSSAAGTDGGQETGTSATAGPDEAGK